MSAFEEEKVLSIRHWNDTLFSFTTTRDASLRFRNGQFLMMGLTINGKSLVRAYSIASPNYEDHLEFFSIKVPDGPLTSHLQHLKEGDTVLISKKPTGSLLMDDLLPGKNLYLFSTGTGLAPFLSVIRDPDTYERFEKIVLIHGVRNINELAYKDYIEQELPQNQYFGELAKEKLIYYPTVTREPFKNEGRINDIIESGLLAKKIGLPELNPETDRVMICGSEAMLHSSCELLERRGFVVSPRIGDPGHYVIEKAFVEK